MQNANANNRVAPKERLALDVGRPHFEHLLDLTVFMAWGTLANKIHRMFEVFLTIESKNLVNKRKCFVFRLKCSISRKHNLLVKILHMKM